MTERNDLLDVRAVRPTVVTVFSRRRCNGRSEAMPRQTKLHDRARDPAVGCSMKRSVRTQADSRWNKDISHLRLRREVKRREEGPFERSGG
jgi:hypothetical protein